MFENGAAARRARLRVTVQRAKSIGSARRSNAGSPSGGACYHDREKEDPGMGAARNYAVIDPATGKLDRRIFSDQAIYDDEMEKIFGRAWLMIGHESLVPAPDDFFHTYMGEDPVILTRDGEGRLHALLNMCRHRGNRVVRVRRRQRQALHVHLSRLDLSERRRPGARPRREPRPITTRSTAVARPRRGARRDLCRHRLRDLGQGRPEPRGLSGRCALVSRHRVQPAAMAACRPWAR